jgi:hypothetical protein
MNTKLLKILDETIKISDKKGNGILRYTASVNIKGKLCRYSFAYINLFMVQSDNGRVLGYDNSHGVHHRHFMGNTELVDFVSFEEIEKRFENEWRVLHEKAKIQKKDE